MRPACFVAVEGLDGVGKSTVARLLAARLGAVLLATPAATLRTVRPALDAYFEPHPLGRALLYAATVAAAAEEAAGALAQGRSVVVDRYWLSTLVYAGLRGVTGLDDIERRLLMPDLTVYLRAPLAVRRRRMTARRRADGIETAEDRRTLGVTVARHLDAAYRTEGARWCGERFLPIDVSTRAPDEIATTLVEILRGGRAEEAA